MTITVRPSASATPTSDPSPFTIAVVRQKTRAKVPTSSAKSRLAMGTAYRAAAPLVLAPRAFRRRVLGLEQRGQPVARVDDKLRRAGGVPRGLARLFDAADERLAHIPGVRGPGPHHYQPVHRGGGQAAQDDLR